MFINGIDINANVYKVPEFCNITLATMDVGEVSLFWVLCSESFSCGIWYCTPVFFKIDRSKPTVDLIRYTNIKYD